MLIRDIKEHIEDILCIAFNLEPLPIFFDENAASTLENPKGLLDQENRPTFPTL